MIWRISFSKKIWSHFTFTVFVHLEKIPVVTMAFDSFVETVFGLVVRRELVDYKPKLPVGKVSDSMVSGFSKIRMSSNRMIKTSVDSAGRLGYLILGKFERPAFFSFSFRNRQQWSVRVNITTPLLSSFIYVKKKRTKKNLQKHIRCWGSTSEPPTAPPYTMIIT